MILTQYLDALPGRHVRLSYHGGVWTAVVYADDTRVRRLFCDPSLRSLLQRLASVTITEE